uniref:Uncharacterized protein n=1 Tax=Cyanistes caeruleus TaxID=156563 RepID=A0A8C0UYY5_CYACU
IQHPCLVRAILLCEELAKCEYKRAMRARGFIWGEKCENMEPIWSSFSCFSIAEQTSLLEKWLKLHSYFFPSVEF